MSSAPWAACLDRLAAHLAHQRALLVQDRPEELEAFAPDAGLGPLPPSLAARARALQEEADALARDLSGRLDASARQLQLVDVLHRPEAARPSYVDGRC